MEIVDETDEVADMQKLARDLWKKRAGEKGIEIPDCAETAQLESEEPVRKSDRVGQTRPRTSAVSPAGSISKKKLN